MVWLHLKVVRMGNCKWVGYDEHTLVLVQGQSLNNAEGSMHILETCYDWIAGECQTMLAEISRELQRVKTALCIREWERSLVAHPDREFCNYVLRGISAGADPRGELGAHSPPLPRKLNFECLHT